MAADFLPGVLEMLGKPLWRYQDPQAWRSLEGELGVPLPADYKQIVDAYAPVQVNHHLYLCHPATDRWNLGERIRRTSRSWSEIDWDDADIEGDPRISLGVSQLAFGTPTGLIPLAGTDRGEEIFYAPLGASGVGSLFIEGGDYEFYEYSCSFAEWLYRWLLGEEMTGPGGSAFYPGPVALEDLPMTPEHKTEVRYGPPRKTSEGP